MVRGGQTADAATSRLTLNSNVATIEGLNVGRLVAVCEGELADDTLAVIGSV